MSKLIDADALIVALGIDLPGYRLSDKGFELKRTINSQPDASEPLRKRIAELEEALRINADLVRDYALYDNPTPEQVENGLMMSANVLLKGAQDA